MARVSQASFNWRLRTLPALYTAFFEARAHGCPVARPLVFAFPGDVANTRGVHLQWLLGDGLLISPVVGTLIQGFKVLGFPGDVANTRGVHLPWLLGDGLLVSPVVGTLIQGLKNGFQFFRDPGSARVTCICSGFSWPRPARLPGGGHPRFRVLWGYKDQHARRALALAAYMQLASLSGGERPALRKHLASLQTARDFELTGLTERPRLQLSHMCN